jgi:hypothetical protein
MEHRHFHQHRQPRSRRRDASDLSLTGAVTNLDRIHYETMTDSADSRVKCPRLRCFDSGPRGDFR